MSLSGESRKGALRALLEELVNQRFGRVAEFAMVLHDADHGEQAAVNALPCTNRADACRVGKSACPRHAAQKVFSDRSPEDRRLLRDVLKEQLERLDRIVERESVD
jgi:hypothetical protein